MGPMAQTAYAHLSAHIPNPVTRDFRAIYQREAVRKYNSSQVEEFIWNSGEWKIRPGLKQWRGVLPQASGKVGCS